MLVDATALMYRMHFGFGTGRLSTEKGEDTSIAYGFVGVILSLLELCPPPTHLVVVFDAAGKTFRLSFLPSWEALWGPCSSLSHPEFGANGQLQKEHCSISVALLGVLPQPQYTRG